MTSYTYDFEPPQGRRILNLSRSGAEKACAAMLDVASRVPGIAPPTAIILFEKNIEIWRWTQIDRLRDKDA